MMSDAHSPVTLIVKAPNQQIEDQTVECELNWTVKRLKGHLSEVYPNQPRTEEQRLIYSGHLLNDGSTLGEVLRTSDGQNQHTLHLVCTQHTQTQTPVSTPNVPSSTPDGLRRRTVDPSISQTSSSESVAREATNSTSLNSSSTSSSSLDVRQLANAFFPGAYLPPPPPTASSPSPSVDSSFDQAPDFQNMQTQYMAWMQQAYAQYMMQYMQFMVANGAQATGMDWSNMPNVGAAPTTSNNPTDAERQIPGNGVAAQREPAARQDDNVVNDDEPANRRDWLEWMYFMFRIVVLFMLVYAYSSPLRFAIVFILGICVYLYQRGYFRLPPEANYLNLRVADNNNEPNVVDAAEEAGARQQNAEVPAAPARQDAGRTGDNSAAVNAVAGSEIGSGAPTNPAVPAEPPRPSLLALTWAFFTCFFTSIIPERPVIP